MEQHEYAGGRMGTMKGNSKAGCLWKWDRPPLRKNTSLAVPLRFQARVALEVHFSSASTFGFLSSVGGSGKLSIHDINFKRHCELKRRIWLCCDIILIYHGRLYRKWIFYTTLLSCSFAAWHITGLWAKRLYTLNAFH